MIEEKQDRPVYIIDGARTPFIKARGEPGPFTPVDLSVQCGRQILLRQEFAPSDIDQVILGCVNVVPEEMNPARLAALRLGMGDGMPAFTMQINCGSGMLSIDTARKYIAGGYSDMILAGGCEALSHAPLLFSKRAVDCFAKLGKARSLMERLRLISKFQARFLAPVIGLERGLTDPIVEMNMGQTAENLAHKFNISRTEADEYAVLSHQRLARAQEQGIYDDEIEPLYAPDGRFYDKDDGVRPDSSAEKLAKLNPVFERPYGKVTAGNSSQITDGASWVLLASEHAVKKHKLEPLAELKASAWSALDPSIMGLGPVLSVGKLLKKMRYSKVDIDLWEINEAFAAQVLSCLKAMDDKDFCKKHLGLEEPIGAPSMDNLNIDGGAISMGHPVGTSGNRIVLHMVRALRRTGKKRGIASMCIGGGQGGAMLVERV